MSTDISNLVCDAVADPPRNSKEQIHIQEQQNQKTLPNPDNSNNSDKLNNQRLNQENSNASDDRESNNEKEQERKKPRRKSRKNSSSSNARGMTINNVVSGSTNVCINFSNQTQINVNGASTSKKDRERSKEASKEMPQYIKNLTECQATITTLDKLTTKQYVGDNWKNVAKNLDLKKGEVEQCFIDHSKEGIGEVMFQILTIWNHRYGKLATLGALIKALWSAKEYVCAEELAAIHKSE